MAQHGKSGKAKIGSNTIADIQDWSLDVDRDTKEVTAFGDSGLPFRSWVGGLVGSSGQLNGNLNMGDTNGQFALWTSLTSDTPISLDLMLDSTHKFSVSVLIEKFSPKSPVGDLETVSFPFKVTGAVVYS